MLFSGRLSAFKIISRDKETGLHRHITTEKVTNEVLLK
jgi:hypothetical protein